MPYIFTQLGSDNFTRADENPLSDGGQWTIVPTFSALQVVSNLCEATSFSAGTLCGAYWGASTGWPNDQYNQATLQATGGSSNAMFISVRRSLITGEAYFLETGSGPLPSVMAVFIHGLGGTTLVSVNTLVSAGDVFRLQVTGIELFAYKNGTQILYVADNKITSGVVALSISDASASPGLQVSAWEAGSAIASFVAADDSQPMTMIRGSKNMVSIW